MWCQARKFVEFFFLRFVKKKAYVFIVNHIARAM